MEYNQNLENVEEISTLVQSLSKFISEQDQDKDLLKRIEAKVDIVAESFDPSESIDASFTVLKDYLDKISQQIENISGKTEAGTDTNSVEHLKEQLNNFLDAVETSNIKLLSNFDTEFDIFNEKLDKLSNIIPQINGEKTVSAESPASFDAEFELIKDKLNGILGILETIPVSDDIQDLKDDMAIIAKLSANKTEDNVNLEEIKAIKNSLLDKFKEFKDEIHIVQSRTNPPSDEDTSDLDGRIGKELEVIKGELYTCQNKIAEMNIDVNDLVEPLQGLKTLEDKLKAILSRVEQYPDVSESTLQMEQHANSIKSLDEKLEALMSLSDKGLDDFEEKIALVKDLSEKTNGSTSEIAEKIVDISSELSDIKNKLKNGSVEGDESGNPDVLNSNFNNLRVGFQNTLDKLEAISQDITDISSRTNKLILTSGDDSKLLEGNLAVFKEVIAMIKSDTESRLSKIQGLLEDGISVPNSEISNKLSNVQDVLTEVANSQKNTADIGKLYESSETVRGCLVQLAEWVDGAGDLLDKTNNRANEIRSAQIGDRENILESIEKHYDNLKELLSLISEKLDIVPDQQIGQGSDNKVNVSPESEDLTGLEETFVEFEARITEALKRFNNTSALEQIRLSIEQLKRGLNKDFKKLGDKFYTLEVRFDTIEEKLDKALGKEGLGYDDEMRQILEFIAGQVTAANEGSRNLGMVSRRIDGLEKTISGFDIALKAILNSLEDR